MRAKKLFQERRVFGLMKGGRIIVFMDLWEVSTPQSGLFLDRYKLSWIAFLENKPGERFLMDSHPPEGLHYHLINDKKVFVQFATLEGALKFFEKKIVEVFGQLKEKL